MLVRRRMLRGRGVEVDLRTKTSLAQGGPPVHSHLRAAHRRARPIRGQLGGWALWPEAILASTPYQLIQIYGRPSPPGEYGSAPTHNFRRSLDAPASPPGLTPDLPLEGGVRQNVNSQLNPIRVRTSLDAAIEDTQGLMLDMLKRRFERAIDRLLDCQGVQEQDSTGRLDALFALYADGILTKGEVMRRGDISDGSFHEEMRAYRTRSRSR
jgi:hypothetical protein